MPSIAYFIVSILISAIITSITKLTVSDEYVIYWYRTWHPGRQNCNATKVDEIICKLLFQFIYLFFF